MKKTTKKSPMMKIVSAAAMLAVSASMLGTSTYAWFTMNKTVEVKGMEVKAKAEKGLLVNEVADVGSATWDEEALSNANANATLIPMSTLNATTWAHANSTKADDAADAQSASVASGNLSSAGYQIFTLADSADGSNLSSGKLDFINATAAAAGANAKADIYYQEKDTTAGAIGDNDDGAFIKYTYYLKSSGSAAITLDQDCSDATDNTIYVKTIKVTGLDKADGSVALAHNLDKTLRVAVVPTGGSATIYAPVAGADTSYFVATAYTPAAGETPASLTASAATLQPGSAAVTAGDTGKVVSTWTATGTGASEGITLTQLPATTSPGAAVDIYIWFEGEDLNCKTNEIYTELDQLTVDITFGLK